MISQLQLFQYRTEQLKVIEGTVSSALALQEQSFNQKLQDIKGHLHSVTIDTPDVETYGDAEISHGRKRRTSHT